MNVALSSPSLAERIEWLIEGLCKVIGAQAYRRGVEAALAWAVWHRVRMLGDRLIALAERVRAGRLPRRRSPRSDTSPRPSPPPGVERKKRMNLLWRSLHRSQRGHRRRKRRSLMRGGRGDCTGMEPE